MKKYNKNIYPSVAARIFRRILWVTEWAGNWVINGVLYGFTRFNTKKTKALKGEKKSLVIIANGPSINSCMEEIMSHKTLCDYACMNYFPINSEFFDRIKPRFMFAFDAMFFDKNHIDQEKRENTVLLKQKFQNIDWDMVLFVRDGSSFELNNSRIKEIQVNCTQIGGVYSRFRGWLFDKGIAVPINATVAVVAIMQGIKMGYRNIYVYGINQSNHENMKVDCNNQTILNFEHFYKEKNTNPIGYDIASVFWDSFRSIKGYRMLEKYARVKGTKVYNCTRDSYVDAFERKIY